MIPLLAAAAVAIEIYAFVPYLRDMRRGTTRPHRGTFAIWLCLSSTAFAAQLADGATWSLALAASQVLMLALILVLARNSGVGGVSAPELALLALAGTGIAGWLVADDPTVATVGVLFADTIAIALMLPKSWRDPWSETASSYLLSGVAATLTVLTVDGFEAALVIYPAFIAATCYGLVGFLHVRRAALSVA